MAGTPARLAGPAFLASSATNVYVPAANTYAIVRHVRVVNQGAGSLTFSLFVGATGGSAAGTEIEAARTVAPGTPVDIYFSPGLVLAATDFLSGIASGASDLVITVMGDKFAV